MHDLCASMLIVFLLNFNPLFKVLRDILHLCCIILQWLSDLPFLRLLVFQLAGVLFMIMVANDIHPVNNSYSFCHLMGVGCYWSPEC